MLRRLGLWLVLLTLVLAVSSGGALAQGNSLRILTHMEPPRMNEPTAGEIGALYTLGTFKVDKYTFPGNHFPLPLDSANEAYITSNFGYRYLSGSYDEHLGVDLRASGSPVYAAAGGKVTVADADSCGGYGRWIEIDHGNGWFTRYAHLQSVAVQVNETVQAGDTIGISGGSGYCSDSGYAPHLHFEVRHLNDGVKIPYDPIAFYTTYSTYVNDVYAANSGYPYIPTKRRGDSDLWVYLVQDSLHQHGYSLGVDGVFGPETEGVVEQFQSDQNIAVDGVVGRQSWRELMGELD